MRGLVALAVLAALAPGASGRQTPARNSVRITLQRTPCLGTCPGYAVTLRGDGAIRFDGSAWVAFPGMHRAWVPRATVATLVEAFRQADFYSLADNYGPACCDAPTYTLSLRLDGRVHVVRDYMGAQSGMPASVTRLENEVDEVTDTKRWIDGDETTIPSLRAEGFDFAASNTAPTLVFLAAWGDFRLIPGLLENGINASRAAQALAPAARHSDALVLRALLAAGAVGDPAALNQALLAAANAGQPVAVNLLLRNGADPHALGRYGDNFLIAAAGSGIAALVQQALSFGLDANQHGASGDTALIRAVGWWGMVKPPGYDPAAVVRLLLAHGADPNQRNRMGDTALLRSTSNFEIVRLLLLHGAQVNVEDDYGITPLMTVPSLPVARLLVAAGADPNYRNRKGETVFTTPLTPPPRAVLGYLESFRHFGPGMSPPHS